MEPLACVVKPVIFMTGISAGEVVLVSGPGPIGLLAAQVAKAEGAFVVLAGTTADQERLKIGRQLGADVTVDVQKEDAVSILRDLNGGYGADVILECSGAGAAVRLGIQAVRKEGRFTQIGILDKPMELDFMTMFHKDLRLTVSYASTYESWERSLALVSRGQVKTEPVISHILPLAEWQKGFDLIRQREGLKIVLQPEKGES